MVAAKKKVPENNAIMVAMHEVEGGSVRLKNSVLERTL